MSRASRRRGGVVRKSGRGDPRIGRLSPSLRTAATIAPGAPAVSNGEAPVTVGGARGARGRRGVGPRVRDDTHRTGFVRASRARLETSHRSVFGRYPRKRRASHWPPHLRSRRTRLRVTVAVRPTKASECRRRARVRDVFMGVAVDGSPVVGIIGQPFFSSSSSPSSDETETDGRSPPPTASASRNFQVPWAGSSGSSTTAPDGCSSSPPAAAVPPRSATVAGGCAR